MAGRRRPFNDQEWAASIERRLAAIEQRDTAPAGRWRFRETAGGDLVATHADGRTVVLSDKPTTTTVVREVEPEEEPA